MQSFFSTQMYKLNENNMHLGTLNICMLEMQA